MALHDRIKLRRQEKGLTAAELARAAGVSKGYLHDLENPTRERPSARPSADVLYRIAVALGTSVADLLEREVTPARRDVSLVLRAYAERAQLPPDDVEMLAAIRFRGKQPQTEDDWRFLYESIRRSVGR